MRIPTWALPLALVGAAACAPSEVARPVKAAVPSQPKRGEGAMREVRATAFEPVLREAGLDAKNLPPLETLDKKQKLRVMKVFTEALGVGCNDCHAGADFTADTRRKRVAKRMFNEIVRLTALENGGTVFCDSCHQGAIFTLDRRDKAKVSDYMSDVFVGKMKRTDNRDHDCGTCHGDPPDFKFVEAWKQRPAPDIELAAPPAPARPRTANAAASPGAPRVVAPAPKLAAVVPPGAAPKSDAAARSAPSPAMSCGENNNLCPLQNWMRQYVATAVASNDTVALAKALDRVAGMSPEPGWGSWVEISRAAAEAARQGDMAGARTSCQGCHNAYKAKWRQSYRERAIK